MSTKVLRLGEVEHGSMCSDSWALRSDREGVTQAEAEIRAHSD